MGTTMQDSGQRRRGNIVLVGPRRTVVRRGGLESIYCIPRVWQDKCLIFFWFYSKEEAGPLDQPRSPKVIHSKAAWALGGGSHTRQRGTSRQFPSMLGTYWSMATHSAGGVRPPLHAWLQGRLFGTQSKLSVEHSQQPSWWVWNPSVVETRKTGSTEDALPSWRAQRRGVVQPHIVMHVTSLCS